jgi:hypothetical protein
VAKNKHQHPVEPEEGLNEKDERVHELSFDLDQGPPSRIGDTRSRRKMREEFPPERVEEAGMTGGELADHKITADDVAPETLLDDNPSHTPAAKEGRDPLDQSLREVGESEIGAGGGLDEAELARKEKPPNK